MTLIDNPKKRVSTSYNQRISRYSNKKGKFLAQQQYIGNKSKPK
jgi:hypothetical protein